MARAPKKDKFHSVATDAVAEMLQGVIDEYHKDLADSEFLVLMKHGGWKSKGKPVLGKIKVLGDDMRRVLGKDAILYLNADMWPVLSPSQKKYVMDHQLYTLDTATDRHGDVKEAADGRPLLKTVPPDIEGFVDVMKRYGLIMNDLKRLAEVLTEAKQLTIEEVAAAQNEQQNEQQHDDNRTGVGGTIQNDGTVDVDKDQLSFDDVPEDGAAADPMAGVLPSDEDDLLS